MNPDHRDTLEEDASQLARTFESRQEFFALLRTTSTQRGLLTIVAGFVLLLWPNRTFTITVGVAGVVLLFGGLSDVWQSRRERDVASAIKGLATAVLGVLLFAYRRRSVDFLANLIAVVAALAAVLDFARAYRARRRSQPWAWFAARAMFEAAIAVSTVALGGYTVELILFFGAALWIATGVITVWHSILYHNDPDFTGRINPPQIAYEWFQARDLGDQDRALVIRNLIFEGDDFRVRATRFIALMSFSTAIAAFGVQTDSTAVVIGAMLVAPLMTPIMATSVSLVMGWRLRAARSLALVTTGVGVAIIISYFIGRFLPSFISVASNSQITSRTSPTTFDLLIALAAGGAGGYAVCRQDVSDSLPGVAISVALVPPLAVVGLTLASHDPELAIGAFLLFLTNFVGIILASGVVFVFVGFSPWSRIQENSKELRESFALVTGALLLIAIPLGITGQAILSTSANQEAAQNATTAWAEESTDLEFVRLNRDGSLIEIVLVGSGAPNDLEALDAELTRIYGRSIDIDMDILPRTSYTTRDE